MQGQVKVQILAALNFDKASKGGYRFQVPADREDGIDTGLHVAQDQVLRFAAQGVISFDDRQNFVNPDGLLCQENGQLIRTGQSGPFGLYVQGNLLMPGQRVGGLVGWIGEMQESRVFSIGSTNTVVAGTDGELHLAVNDIRGTYGDNSGIFKVGVRVE